MKRIVLALVLLAACRTAPKVGTQTTGAPSPRAAVDRLLSAIKDQDLQALGAVWGDTRGAARDIMPRDEYDQRVMLMQCYFSHAESRVSSPTTKSDTVLFGLELSKGSVRAQTTARTIQGPGSRWYVMSLDPVPQGLCRR
jgi:hypothetical protein